VLDVQDVVIDGEIVALHEKGRSCFQLLQWLDMGQVRPPIVFYPFDLLRLNGKDLEVYRSKNERETGRPIERASGRNQIFGPHSQKTYQSFWIGLGRSGFKA
jgi:hypothetical protein